MAYSVKMNLKSAMNGSLRDLVQSPFREPSSAEVLEQFYRDRELGIVPRVFSGLPSGMGSGSSNQCEARELEL